MLTVPFDYMIALLRSVNQFHWALVDMYTPHIIHATETHLDKQISNAELIDPLLYDIYRKDRLFDPGQFFSFWFTSQTSAVDI
jgi:hypothetical protein